MWHLKHEVWGNKPWAVQAEAMRRADGRERFGQFLEQGLGKTPLTLNEFVGFDDVDIMVVLAPGSFIADWPLAANEWGLSFLWSGRWGKTEMPHDVPNGVYAIAHETLRGSRRARDEMIELFKRRACMLVIDEATGIKNPASVLAQWIMSTLVKEAVRVRLLDGTPMVQNVLDYYPKLRALGELNGMPLPVFRARYALIGGYMGRQIIGVKEENQEELGRIIDGCAFRALKKDWRKDLPPQLSVPIHLDMTDRQREHYQTMMEEFYAMVTASDGESEEVFAEMVLTQRIKLQQISSGMLMKDGRAFFFEQPDEIPKLRAAFDLMDTGYGKMIVVYYFDPSGRMLIDQFQKKGFNPSWITGGMEPEEIVHQKERFNKDPDCRILVGQIDQTSRGHTLIGQKGKDRCFKIYYYETSLSLMHRLQMNDRNHRGEQDETCLLYDPITCPIDQINSDILTKKKTAADGMDAILKYVREGHSRGY